MVRTIGLAMILLGGLGLGLSFIDWSSVDASRPNDQASSDRTMVGDQEGLGNQEGVGDENVLGALVVEDLDADKETIATNQTGEPGSTNGVADDEVSNVAVVLPPSEGTTTTTEPSSPASVKVFERETRVDDVGPTLWADIAAASDVVSEDSGYANFLVTLSEPAQRSVVIIFSTVDLSANDDEDYLSQRGTVTFQPGVVSAEIQTPLVDDDIKEEDEQFAIVLNGAPGIVNFKSRRVTATIRDDD